eukprot:TRINITY_DN8102_c0_g1_i4.p1 TRINITY_DN8102_c0_g1~~TRINITY_DN8102_c0_g1_i4.p1  ORF type:complete len:617 (+),score=154.63 TRINITY_DN8102_c0_g1_i4:186-2036(+)
METAEDSPFSPQAIGQLIDNLKAQDLDARLASLRSLAVIAKALGEQRTRDELIPYLTDSIDDEDEAMAELAQRLSDIIDLVGGSEHVLELIPAFEELASSEEAIVRNRAAQGLNKLAVMLDSRQLYDAYIPLVDRMTSAHWFSLRTTACSLYSVLYTAVKDEDFKQNVIQAYEQLCRDSTPMVRRAAASNLKDMMKCCSAKVVSERLKPLFILFMEDEQDSVRLLGTGLLPELARSLPASQHATVIAQHVDVSVNDASWRVRYMLADVIVELQQALASELSDMKLLPAFVQLLQDTEPEVRTCAATKVHDFCLGLGSTDRVDSVVGRILPNVEALVADASEHCRAAIATVIMGVSSIVGKANTIEHLLPMFLKLLKDEHSKVRLNVISKLEEVNQVIGLDHLTQALLPAIEELAQNDDWRTRLAIIEYIPVVSKQLGEKFFTRHLLEFATRQWMRDSVFAVRSAAIKNLHSLVAEFGVDWAEKVIFPALKAMSHETHFVHRLTTLFALASLCDVVTESCIQNAILPIVTPLQEDSIPNIRMNVAKTLSAILKTTGARPGDVSNVARTVLDKLSEDKDRDVRDFAVIGLSSKTCETVGHSSSGILTRCLFAVLDSDA